MTSTKWRIKQISLKFLIRVGCIQMVNRCRLVYVPISTIDQFCSSTSSCEPESAVDYTCRRHWWQIGMILSHYVWASIWDRCETQHMRYITESRLYDEHGFILSFNLNMWLTYRRLRGSDWFIVHISYLIERPSRFLPQICMKLIGRIMHKSSEAAQQMTASEVWLIIGTLYK